MSSTPLADEDAPQRLDAIIRQWSALAINEGSLVAMETSGRADDRGQHRWLLRLAGEEKDFITLWLTLRQRTVHVEAHVMPAPSERVQDVYQYLLAKNADLYELHFALGPEAAIYLVGRLPVGDVTAERLDELCGAALHYVDEFFPTAMSLGHGSWYRRKRRRNGTN